MCLLLASGFDELQISTKYLPTSGAFGGQVCNTPPPLLFLPWVLDGVCGLGRLFSCWWPRASVGFLALGQRCWYGGAVVGVFLGSVEHHPPVRQPVYI